MNFLNRYKSYLEPFQEKMLRHPFFTNLMQGRLSETVFRFFIIQDALYLGQCGPILASLSTKAPTDEDILLFCECARVSSMAEKNKLLALLRTWGISAKELDSIEASPDCRALADYQYRIIHLRPYHECITAIATTYLMYAATLQKIIPFQDILQPIHQQWVGDYADPTVSQHIDAMIRAIDRAGDGIPSTQQEAILSVAGKIAQLELRFLDGAYHRRTWPV